MAANPKDAPIAPIIVVKRVKKGGHGHHGGVWKIAYADFVTAMMAFFLLMWVLGSTTSGDLAGISSYFQNPLRASINGGNGSGDRDRIIKGGGDNLFKTDGQEARADADTDQRRISDSAMTDPDAEKAKTSMEAVKAEIEQQIASNPEISSSQSQVFMDVTSEGLRIQIVDSKNRPMFDSGSANLLTHTKTLLRTVGRVLSGVPNKVRVEGHTDNKPFGNGPAGYTNWELSSERANAARREMIGGGFKEDAVSQVIGYADSMKLNPEDAADPRNRRISILVQTGGGNSPKAKQAAASGSKAKPEAGAPLQWGVNGEPTPDPGNKDAPPAALGNTLPRPPGTFGPKEAKSAAVVEQAKPALQTAAPAAPAAPAGRTATFQLPERPGIGK
jgi:chemotaxis protein MotB